MTKRAEQPIDLPAVTFDVANAEGNRRALERARRMTPDQIFELSVRAGVHRATGGLTPEYGGSEDEKKLPSTAFAGAA